MSQVNSLTILNQHYDNVLSTLQDLKEELYGNRVEITFHSNGGSPVRNQVVYMRQSYGELPKPYKAGYDFAGWYKVYDNVTVPGEEFFDGLVKDFDVVLADTHFLDLYAKWEPAWIAIHLDAQGGVVEPDEISVRYLSRCADAYQGPGLTTGLPFPYHPDNKFFRWTSDKPVGDSHGTQVYDNSTQMVRTEPFTLYANWQRMVFSLVYDANGGVGSYPSLTAHAGELCAIVSTTEAARHMSRVGYDLDGFSLFRNSPDTVTSVQFDSKDLTAYAVWRRHGYKIQYYDRENRLLTTYNKDPKASPYNPQTVMVDWIDYLNFMDEFEGHYTLKETFRRWTSIKNAYGEPTNPYVAALMPYDGDLVYNYATNANAVVRIKPATGDEIAAVESKSLVKVDVVANPLSGASLLHGDTISSDMGPNWTRKYPGNPRRFVLSALYSDNSTATDLSGNAIRVYPSMAKYYTPTPDTPISNSYVVASYAHNGVAMGVKIPIVVRKTVSFMEVVERPRQIEYTNGDTMNPSGLALSVVYADGADSELLEYDLDTDGRISCTMTSVLVDGHPDMERTTVTKKANTMFVYFQHEGRMVSSMVNLFVKWATTPTMRLTVTDDPAKKSFEPDEETEVDTSEHGINLVVEKVYSDPPDTYNPGDNVVAVHDYTISPKIISEDSITDRTPNDPAYQGKVRLSVLYGDFETDTTISGTVMLNVYWPYGISSITINGTPPASLTSMTMPYQSKYIQLDPMQYSSLHFTGHYNRHNTTDTADIIGTECRITPYMLDPTVKSLTFQYGNAKASLPIEVKLDAKCYCGRVVFDESLLKSSARESRCLNREVDGELSPVNPAPVFNAQCYGGDYSYWYNGDKYLQYEVSSSLGRKYIIKKSEGDSKAIGITEWKTLVGEAIYSGSDKKYNMVSVYYTSPPDVEELNNNIITRTAGAGENSIVDAIFFNTNLNNVTAIRNIATDQRKMRYFWLGHPSQSNLEEIDANAFTSCFCLSGGMIGRTEQEVTGNASLGNFYLSPKLTTIGNNCFAHTAIQNLLVVTWEECRDSNYALKMHLSALGVNAFIGCSRLKFIDRRVFGRNYSAGNDSTSWYGNAYLSTISEGCFAGCNLTTVHVGEVMYLEKNAFLNCSHLQSIEFNKDVLTNAPGSGPKIKIIGQGAVVTDTKKSPYPTVASSSLAAIPVDKRPWVHPLNPASIKAYGK